MANNSSLSKRAALRQQQELEEQRRRTKRILIGGGVLLGVVALFVMIFVVVQAISKSFITEDQVTPANATASHGILLDGKKPQDGKPHLVIWQDAQCPACKSVEGSYGPVVQKLVDAGKITAEVRTASFLDEALRNDSSHRAAVALAAADHVGKFSQYHTALFQNQPAEGRGFTDQQLRDDFATQAGITGDDLTTFQRYYDTKAFNDFAKKTNQRFKDDKITGTPAYLVSGQQLQFAIQGSRIPLIHPTEESVMKAIDTAFQKGGKKHA